MPVDPHLSRERSERFETAFNRIHQTLKQISRTNGNDAFMEILHDAARTHASVKACLEDLKQYAKLRNAIVHHKKDAQFYIAEPHHEIVERIESIDRLLTDPGKALSIASAPVYTVEMNTLLTTVLKYVEQHGYSGYPIYEKGRCRGLLTAKTILQWMAIHHQQGKLDLSALQVKDLVTENTVCTIVFLSQQANIYDIEFLFEDHQARKQKLEAVLITPNGRESELPIGIITAWDLTKNNDQIIGP
ncbi:CBS domain-containing protein [Bacillus ectoiniformans]|uniref:CBS domain-containing protein n=1 Tax=Bacillus ectoiniformans TaxID=1494429 RepID=UPI00195A200C|nr:CBS domain-containing protein [Bacillus ectoiniformans]MBM7647779.1 CBS domain-containing protein [Bacillus ectoiniformans]